MRRLLRRQGYAATGLTQLLAEAEATNGSLYHHFPGGKEQLAAAAIQESAGEVETSLRLLFEKVDDPIAAVESWIDVAIATLERDPQAGCPVAPTAIEAASASEPLRASAAAAFAAWTDALETALARTRPSEVATGQSRAVLAAVEGALLLDRTARTTDHLTALRAAVPGLLSHELRPK